MTPFPTPRAAQNLAVRPVQPTASVPPVQPAPTPRAVNLNVQIFNDPNRSGMPDPGEGISNVSVRVSDEASGAPLAQGLTDADGRASFALDNPGPIRLSVPMFGYTTVITDQAATVRIAVMSAVDLPPRLP